jgi:FkbM family methyltransferase
MKAIARRALVAVHLDGPLRQVRRRIRLYRAKDYDAQTEKVLKRVLRSDSNCVDVGCHQGIIMDMVLRWAPNGHHLGVEPLPDLAQALRTRYASQPNVEICEVALAAEPGVSAFQHVVTNSAYSGIRRRKYPRDEEVQEIIVQLARLDDLVPAHRQLSVIKIDVEGAELDVLRGAVGILKRDRPFVVFEHGPGAAEFYGATPESVWDLLAECGLSVSLLADWLKGRDALGRSAFIDEFKSKRNYYFLAHV